MEPNWHYLLECPVQNYDWGNSDPEGIIHTLLADHAPLPAGATAAELWMGAHPSAPARLSDGTRLQEAIAADPAHFLGPTLSQRGAKTLPFLFKVLDASRPLSIQAHPDLAGAKRLHARDPEHYPDDNHKPELAICLRDMRALMGFRPVNYIRTFLDELPELARLCAPETVDSGLAPRDWIRALYGNLMRASAERIDASARFLLRREEKTFVVEKRLFEDLTDQFGTRDPGIFSIFFLNYVELKFGEAIFLGPNEPHAYLSGQILECMAASDNVVRAGLTGKFMDVETLLEMLHYNPGLPDIKSPRPSGQAESYEIPVRDFVVRRWHCAGQTARIQNHDRPSVFLILKGEIQLEAMGDDAPAPTVAKLPKGRVFFLPGDLAGRGITVSLLGTEDAIVYQATVAEDY